MQCDINKAIPKSEINDMNTLLLPIKINDTKQKLFYGAFLFACVIGRLPS